MIYLPRSQSSDIRIFLNLSLMLVKVIIVLALAVQPARQIDAGFTFHSFTEHETTKYTINWTLSKKYIFFWEVNSFWFRLGFMYLDFWSFDKIRELRGHDRFYPWILAQSVSWLRVFGTCSLIYLLSGSWTWAELGFDSIMVEQAFRMIAATLEVLLLKQLYIVKLFAR